MIKLSSLALAITIVCSVVHGIKHSETSELEHKIDTMSCIIVIDDSSNCSSLPSKLQGWECHPLSVYVKNMRKYFANNTKMLFTEGTHQLPLPPDAQTPVVNVTGIANFSMIGIGAVKYSDIPSEVGSPLPSSIVSCNTPKENNTPRNGILFHKTSSILIENLTIEGCGAMFTIHRPETFTMVSALTFHVSYDIKLTQVRIERSIGFGLDADRNFGLFSVWRSAFLRSKAYGLENKYIGGNARFWYSKYNTSFNALDFEMNILHIYHSWFMHGETNTYREKNFASGLIVVIYIPCLHVKIHNTTVSNNIGSRGGNLAMLVTDYHENASTINITDSLIANGWAVRGGGMQFWIQVHRTNNFYTIKNNKLAKHYSLNISRTKFVNNSAAESGGGIYIGHYQSKSIDYIIRHVLFKNCTFSNNSVHYKKGQTISFTGAAVEIIRHNIDDFVPHTLPQYSMEFNRCLFVHNELKEVANEGGILDLVSTQSVNITDCKFIFNEGTAISLRQSNMRFNGHTIFKGNRGSHGGALKFCQTSKMYLPNNNVTIDFIDNQAYSTGGAIYISQQLCLETAPACFFQPVRHKNVSVEKLNITLCFKNNTAQHAGDAIYGGQVDHCYLYYSNVDNQTTYLSKRAFKKIFNLRGQRTSLSQVSSIPYGACFYNTFSHKVDCESKTYPGIVYPGQSITLNLAAVGQHNGTSPVKYNSFYFEQVKNNNCHSKLEMKTSNTGNNSKQHASIEYIVYSNCTQSNTTFDLSVLQANLAELRYMHYPQHRLSIKIGECPWGFELDAIGDTCRCICAPQLRAHGFHCDIDTQYITAPGHIYGWLGCIDDYHKSNKNNGTRCKDVALANRCFEYYCKTTKTNITWLTLDDQCTEGREGILCGRCKANYSLALGTQRCLPSCPVYMVYIVVLTCTAGGIMLILFLIACNFTISEGTINGLFFYAHVVHRNTYIFFPSTIETSNSNIFRLFIAWLNLDIGFEVCFYKSMDQYQKVSLEFGFLSYIWVLIFLIVMLSRRYIFFTRLVGRNIVKVIATLGLMCFPQVSNIAISCLQTTYISHFNNQQSVFWQTDGNIEYLRGKHIPLFILGLVLVLLCLLPILALLFIQCLQRNSNLFCLTWVNRLRPFFDAYTGPCHKHYQFWPGWLFFARLVLFSLNSHIINKNNINLYIIITACALNLIVAFVLPHGVYRRWTVNVLESVFFLNLGITSGYLVYYSNKYAIRKRYSFEWTKKIVYPSVALTMVLFAGILIYHCVKQLQSYRFCKKLSLSAFTKRLRLKKLRHGLQRVNDEEREPFLKEDMHQVVGTSNEYREELIED